MSEEKFNSFAGQALGEKLVSNLTSTTWPRNFVDFANALALMQQGKKVMRKGYPYVLFWVKNATMSYVEQGFMKAIQLKGTLMIMINDRVDVLTADNDLMMATDFYVL